MDIWSFAQTPQHQFAAPQLAMTCAPSKVIADKGAISPSVVGDGDGSLLGNSLP